MDIVVLGATGRTGRLVVERAVAEGHRLTAVVRSADHAPFPEGVAVVRVDVTDARSLTGAVAGAGAVIGTLGATSGPLIERSTAALIEAAAQGGPRRVVLLSGYSVLTGRLTRPARLMAGTVMKAMTDDKAAGERLLRSSDLDWTIVHAVRLGDGPGTNRPRVLPDDAPIGLRATISRADVAAFLVDALSDPTLSGRGVAIAA